MNPSPLDGIRVVELATALQGPLAGQYLADHGASVIKIEPPSGDASRFVGRYRDPGHGEPKSGSQFVSANRGKASICLDLHTTFGRRAAAALVATADVFLTNFRQPALERLELDAKTLRRRHPELIYARASGFGPLGPDADKAMIDGAAQARGGIAALSGTKSMPTPPGCMLADTAGALALALGILTGLAGRLLHGRAQRIDTSALGTQLYLQSWELQHAFLGGAPSVADGPHHALLRGVYGVYRTRDGEHLFIGVFQEREAWDRFWAFAGMSDVAGDPRWSDLAQQLTVDESVLELLRSHMRMAVSNHTSAAWSAFLAREPRIIWERVRAYRTIADDPQNLDNGYLARTRDPASGAAITTVGNPVMVEGVPRTDYDPPPRLGQDTLEVLQGVGFSRTEVEAHLRHCQEAQGSPRTAPEGVK